LPAFNFLAFRWEVYLHPFTSMMVIQINMTSNNSYPLDFSTLL